MSRLALVANSSKIVSGLCIVVLSDFGRSSLVLLVLGVIACVAGLLAIGLGLRERRSRPPQTPPGGLL